jgi:glycolate oxidase iron-sulfur subunit
MQTNLADFIKDTAQGREADSILRSCVHCGFCLATCPTYQLLGDELDSPRGRIYLIKQVLEGGPVTAKTQLHLDRCLTCRACETTCPSGVKYGHLVDIGRNIVEQRIGRSPSEQLKRLGLRSVLSNKRLFNPLLKLGRAVQGFLPAALQTKLPPVQASRPWPQARHPRSMLVLDGCVQPGLAPNINAAAARVLDRLGISLLRAENAGCCGAVSYHLNAQEQAMAFMRRNIDAWWPYLGQGVEALVMTASGCGATVKEYGYLLRHDPAYAEKAARISALTRDLSEILAAEQTALTRLINVEPRGKLAFHSPCTLQHGQKIVGAVERILTSAGFELTPMADPHLCCGSAGTYSILQPEISQQLLRNKVSALEGGAPQQIATANIGCLTHLQSGTTLRVRHWVELIEATIG